MREEPAKTTMPHKRRVWRNPEEYSNPLRDSQRRALVMSELREHLGDLKGKRILDIGCGKGALLKMLRDAGAEGHGIDVHWENVKAARGAGLNAVKGDATNLADYFSRHRKFDAVVSTLILEPLVLSGANANRVLASAASLTKPGGVHVHLTANPTLIRRAVSKSGLRLIRKSEHGEQNSQIVVARKR